MIAASTIQRVGQAAFQLQPPLPHYSPQEGGTQDERYKGPSNQLVDFVGQMSGAGATVRTLANNGIIAEVLVSWPRWQDGSTASNTTIEQPQWSLQGNDLSKDIFTHPGFQALGLDQQKYLREVRGGDDSNVALIDAGAPALFLDLVVYRVETYTVSQWVLNLSAVLAPTWSGPISVAHVGAVYEDTASLRATESVPTSLAFPLPSGQWLKRTPSFRARTDGRWDYSQEWWHADEWVDTLYTARV